tara:strand:+ start:514 stop:690 length:177 start_codon:yes stop_codon:yes gene_type:complete
MNPAAQIRIPKPINDNMTPYRRDDDDGLAKTSNMGKNTQTNFSRTVSKEMPFTTSPAS